MYNKDHRLRAEGEQIEYTPEMINEFIRCKEDIIYFAEKYFNIISSNGEHCIQLREYQKRMLKAMVGGDSDPRPYVCCVASRQIGKCVEQSTKIKVRNKYTNEIVNIRIGQFYDNIVDLYSKPKNSIIKVNMNNPKFIESYDIDDWDIETDEGFKPVTHIHKTVQYDTWMIKTKRHHLKCADEHIVIGEYGEQVFVKDLNPGDLIFTTHGYEPIIFIQKTTNKKHMYDITVNSQEHVFWTNGILSHNTTISTVYLVHFLLFNELKNVAILANREKTAIEIINKIKMAYRNLPLWLQSGISDEYGGWVKTAIGLENGCRCIASTTASAAIRGMTIGVLFLDEYAFVPREIADDFYSSVYPTITRNPNAKIIIVSTPNGLNHFYDVYKGAVSNQNNYRPIKVNWWEVEGQDDAWKKKIIRDIGIIKFNQEYGCSKKFENINIKDDKTGETNYICIGELYEKLKTENDNKTRTEAT